MHPCFRIRSAAKKLVAAVIPLLFALIQLAYGATKRSLDQRGGETSAYQKFGKKILIFRKYSKIKRFPYSCARFRLFPILQSKKSFLRKILSKILDKILNKILNKNLTKIISKTSVKSFVKSCLKFL